MRIVYLGNNWLGWKVLEWLMEQGEEIVGLVIHPADRRTYGQEIIATAGLDREFVFDGATLRRPEVVQEVERLGATLGLSILFDYILEGEFIRLFSDGILNLHPALLPYNRGQYPNVWSIVEGTPAGATLHYIDEGIDTGDLVAQREVVVEPVDTGESLYRKLEAVSLELFKGNWPAVKRRTAPRLPQASHGGTYHKARDVDLIDHIDPEATYKAGRLIDILRARTFPPHKGAYFISGGRKVYLRLELHDSGDPDNG